MHDVLDLTNHWVGGMVIAIFVFAYALVIAEEQIHMKKSKPVLIAAGIVWALIGFYYTQHDMGAVSKEAALHNLVEYTEIFLFLLSAMVYINALTERNVFEALKSWIIRKGWSSKTVFVLTGALAFMISPVADNLTTAVLMGAVVLTIGRGNKDYISICCVSIVIAANAGGAFSPFGDITTLMVWQKGIVEADEFLRLFIPSLVNWLVPAFVMFFFVPKIKIIESNETSLSVRKGGFVIIFLFFMTIVTAVTFHNLFSLPPAMGMMLGLGYLKIFGFYLKKKKESSFLPNFRDEIEETGPYDIMQKVKNAEWDTLLFFYGIIMIVGGIKFIGYLDLLSTWSYGTYGATASNIGVGGISAVLDNIPVMFAVLSMMPDMSHGQWLLVTLTAGVGGSMLSIGSAAGVALMGTSKGNYGFWSHLKWTPVIALGYVASIWVHMAINQHLF